LKYKWDKNKKQAIRMNFIFKTIQKNMKLLKRCLKNC